MTHDELLAKIDDIEEIAYKGNPISFRRASYDALRAVVELPMETDAKSMNHRPKFSSDEEAAVWFCKYGYATAMNQVIQAIEKELK